MRALAHPTRLRLLAELRVHGPQTVGVLSQVIGEAVGNVSYHIRQLAEQDLVVEVPELARDRRERWWQAAHPRTVLDPLEGLDDPEKAEASQALRQAFLRRYLELLEQYLDIESSLEPEWVRSGVSSDAILHLTADQLGDLRQELEDLAGRWEARSDPRRATAHPVALIYHAFRRPQ